MTMIEDGSQSLQQIVEVIGTRTFSQVYCKLQNLRCRKMSKDPAVTRLLKENWRTYYRIKHGDRIPSSQPKVPNPHGIKKKKRTRKLWSRSELMAMFQTLRKNGLSISAIIRALNGQRSEQQVILKLRSIQKWPYNIPDSIIKIINSGSLSKNS